MRLVRVLPLVLEQLLVEVSVDQLKQQWVDSGKVPESDFQRVVEAFTKNGKPQTNYITWFIKKVDQGLVLLEDLDRWVEEITVFERFKQRFEKKDINQYKTEQDLEDFRDRVIEIQRQQEDKVKGPEQKPVEKNASEVEKYREFYLGTVNTDDKGPFYVFRIPSERDKEWLAKELGKGTSWCTAKYAFWTYAQKGPLYVFVSTRDPKQRYQMHVETNQLKDARDIEVSYGEDFVTQFYKFLHEKYGVPYSSSFQKALDIRKQLATAEGSLSRNLKDAERYLVYGNVTGTGIYGLDSNTAGEAYQNLAQVGMSKGMAVDILKHQTRIKYLLCLGDLFQDRALLLVPDGYNNSCYMDSNSPIRKDQITEEQYNFLKKASITGYFMSELTVKYDKSLPDLKDFRIGRFNGTPAYLVKKGDKAIKLEFGMSTFPNLDNPQDGAFENMLVLEDHTTGNPGVKFTGIVLDREALKETSLVRFLTIHGARGIYRKARVPSSSCLPIIEKPFNYWTDFWAPVFEKVNSILGTNIGADQFDDLKAYRTLGREKIASLQEKWLQKGQEIARSILKRPTAETTEAYYIPVSDSGEAQVILNLCTDRQDCLYLPGLRMSNAYGGVILLSGKVTHCIPVEGRFREISKANASPTEIKRLFNINNLKDFFNAQNWQRSPGLVKLFGEKDGDTAVPKVSEFVRDNAMNWPFQTIFYARAKRGTRLRRIEEYCTEVSWSQMMKMMFVSVDMGSRGGEFYRALKAAGDTTRIFVWNNDGSWNMHAYVMDKDGQVQGVYKRVGSGMGLAYQYEEIPEELRIQLQIGE